MDENTKKQKIKELQEQLKTVEEFAKPFLKEIEKIKSQISMFERLKKVGDKIRWEHLWDHREEDSYTAEILEVNIEKRIYKVKITDFYSSYGGRSSAHQIIGRIEERGI